MYRFLLVLSLFLLSSLSANDGGDDPEGYDPFDFEMQGHLVPNPEPTSLVNMTAMPSSTVNGSVNVISGDFFESNEDHIVSGPDPYSLGHTYSSSALEKGTLDAVGWYFYHHHYLQVYQPEGINFARPRSLPFEPSESSCFASTDSQEELLFTSELQSTHSSELPPVSDSSSLPLFNLGSMVPRGLKKNKGGYKVHGTPPNEKKNPYTYLYLKEPSGGELLFKGNGWAKNFRVVKKNTGFTNVTGGEIGGQTNIKNIKIKWYHATDHWHVTFGDGTRRVYGRMKKPKDKRSKYRK
jgi:hypothetical protein